MHPVNHLPFVLGRGSDADFRLDDKGVSRRHLQLSMQGGAVVASDMGSTNGTLINGGASACAGGAGERFAASHG